MTELQNPESTYAKSYHKHKDKYNKRRRAAYSTNRDAILQERREDRIPCKHCGLCFTRPYMNTHIKRRHLAPLIQFVDGRWRREPGRQIAPDHKEKREAGWT